MIDRAKARAQFAASVNVLVHCDAYWCPSRKRVVFRSVQAQRRLVMPSDAVLIGRYQHPFAARDFLKDLDDVLARLEVGILARLPV